MPTIAKKLKRKAKVPEHETSCGNVFKDLELPNPEETLLKALIVRYVRSAIESRKLTQVQAGELMGVDQGKVSLMLRGRTHGFSLDRIIECAVAVGLDLEISVRANPVAVGGLGKVEIASA